MMDKKTIFSILTAFLFIAAMPAINAATGDYAYLIEITETTILPSSPQPGDAVSIVYSLRNKGYSVTAYDINAILDLDNQFEPVDMDEFMGAINPQSTKDVVFRFKVKEDTPQGYYTANLTLNYLKSGEPVTERHAFSIPVSQEATEKTIDVTIDPRVINPGNQTEAVFSLENVGSTPVSNISFSWSDASALVLPVGSDNKRYVDYILPGGKKDVLYTVAADPNIAPGIYPLDVELTFSESGGTRTQASQLGVIIGGATTFEVSAEIVSTSQLSISIANIGSNNAGAVVVRIPEQQSFRVSGSSTSIVGNLNKGDFTLANFELRSSMPSAAAGFRGRASETSQTSGTPETAETGEVAAVERPSGKLLIEIDYTDTTGERRTASKEIELSYSSSGTDTTAFAGRARATGQDSTLPWALLILLVLGAAVFNKFRARLPWKGLAKTLAICAVLFLAAIFLLGSDTLGLAAAAIISLALLGRFFRVPAFLSAMGKIRQMIPFGKKQGK
ncbi:MAG: hypothetical protein ABH854_03880 [Candidatus Diapherotrites archaeon]